MGSRLYRTLLAALVAIMIVGIAVSASALTVEEIVQLKKLGVSDDEIIDAIKNSKSKFTLTTQQKLYLIRNKVSIRVIRYMQSLHGTTPKTTTTTPNTTPTPTPTVDPKLEEQRRKQQEQERKEQQARIKEEMEKQKRLQALAYAQGQLKKGMDLAKEGRFVEAIQVFQLYLQNGHYKPGSEQYYNAKYGIANALVRAKLYQSAASILLDVVLEGPKRQFFDAAFEQLLELRQKVEYYPDRLEGLAKFCNRPGKDLANASCQYLMGEYYFNQGKFTRALRQLKLGFVDKGPKNHPRRAAVYYLLGIYNVELLKPLLASSTKDMQMIKMRYRNALRYFQNAVLAAEQEKQERVVHLSYIALARLSFALGANDAAIFYYRKVPNKSPLVSTAFYESAWAYFTKGDYSRALGMFHALHSPYFRNHFYPELNVLEAAVYMNMCYVDLAEKQMKEFTRTVGPQAMALRAFLGSLRGRSQLYKIVREVASGSTKHQLTERLLFPVLSDVEFYNRHRTIRQIQSELNRLSRKASQLGTFGDNIVKRLNRLRAKQVREINNRIHRVLTSFEGSLANWTAKLSALRVDLNQLKIDELTRKTRELIDKDSNGKKKTKKSRTYKLAVVGADQSAWKFEGEYWYDELGSIRSLLRERCSR